MNQRSKSAYQAAATAGATIAELSVVVYSSLASDFLRAAEAVRNKNINERCACSKHALLLIGNLESWTSGFEDDDPKMAKGLRDFYAMLRQRTLHLQTVEDEGGFRELAGFVFLNSDAWQTISSRFRRPDGVIVPSAEEATQGNLSLSA